MRKQGGGWLEAAVQIDLISGLGRERELHEKFEFSLDSLIK